MAKFAISGRTTIVGTSALPNVSLYATSAVIPKIVEIHLWNTSTSTSCVVALNRLTTTGTQGAGLTEECDDSNVHVALATGFAGHTSGPTIGAEKQRATLAALGGVIWTWSTDAPLMVPAGTANGVGVLVPTGTGQTLDYTIKWIE